MTDEATDMPAACPAPATGELWIFVGDPADFGPAGDRPPGEDGCVMLAGPYGQAITPALAWTPAWRDELIDRLRGFLPEGRRVRLVHLKVEDAEWVEAPPPPREETRGYL